MAYKGKQIKNPAAKMQIRFLQTAADTGGQLLEMRATYAPHSNRPVEHYHPSQDEDFKVISGELTVKINGTMMTLRAGQTLHVPRRTVHSMWNHSDNETVLNWQVRPAMNTENFLEIAAGLATERKMNNTGRPPAMQAALLAGKYSGVFRMPGPPFIIQRIIFSVLTPLAWLTGYRPVYKKYFQ